MSDETQFTPHERVTLAYERMAQQAKPYRPDPAAQADRAVVRYDQLQELRDAIEALPGDAFGATTYPVPVEMASLRSRVAELEDQLESAVRLSQALGDFKTPEEALACIERGKRLPAVTVPPPIPRLPQGYDNIECWEAMRMIADFFDTVDQQVQMMFGTPRDGLVQKDLRMWANEIERRYR